MRGPNMRGRLRKSRSRCPQKGAHASSKHAAHCTAQVMISFSKLCMPQSSPHLHIRSAASCAARRLWKCI